MHFQRDYRHSYLVNKKPILHRVCKQTRRTNKNNQAKVSGLSCVFFWLLFIFLAAKCHSRGMSCVAARHQSCAINHTWSNNQITVEGFLHPAQSLELFMLLKKWNKDSPLPQLLHKAFPGCSRGTAAVVSYWSLSCFWGQFVVSDWFGWLVCSFITILGISCWNPALGTFGSTAASLSCVQSLISSEPCLRSLCKRFVPWLLQEERFPSERRQTQFPKALSRIRQSGSV